MSDEAAFIRSILAQPDDDTLRLVYADYLDERGGDFNSARAEFIRLQVRNATQPGAYWCLTGVWRKPRRFSELLSPPWSLHEVMTEVRSGSGYVQPSNSTSAVLWRRGFIEAVLCSGKSISGLIQELKEHPVREVRLFNEPDTDFMQRIHPDWPHGNLFAYSAVDRDKLLLKLLTGQNGFPVLRIAKFDYHRPGDRTCPFAIVSEARNLAASAEATA